MKKIALFMSALALAFSFTACDQKEDGNGNGNGGVDLDNVTEDGFFVAGPATGAEKIGPEYMMTAGVNEVLMDQQKLSWDDSKREGMFEKYIVLEADKDFELLLNEAGSQTRYSASLEAYKAGEGSDGTIDAFRGELKVGADAPAMKVSKTGLYHIVLDLNNNNDLLYPQIIVVPVTWGVRGDCNGWGFTAFEAPATFSNAGITYTLENQEFGAGGKFKFAHDGIWKLQIDDAGNVKAHTNLGTDSQNGGADIVVEKAGWYTITLTYTLKGGAIANSYKYEVTLTKESDMPTEMYMTGTDFGSWTWGAEGIVKFTETPNAGEFWAIRYLTANNGVKFSSINEKDNWSKAFGSLGTNNGFTTDGDGNAVVAESGLYMIVVDVKNNAVTIEPAVVYGIGDTFGGWNEAMADAKFAVNADGKTLSITAPAAGPLRMYAAYSGAAAGNWWQYEFHSIDGKIAYRGKGGELEPYQLTAGQVVTLDFTAGTAVVE